MFWIAATCDTGEDKAHFWETSMLPSQKRTLGTSFGCESGNRLALGVKPSANSQPLPKQYMSVDFHLELELALVVLVVLVVLVNRLG